MIQKIKLALLLAVAIVIMSPSVSSAAMIPCPPLPPGAPTFGICDRVGIPLPGGSLSGGGWSTGNVSSYGLPEGSITGIIKNILTWLLMIFGIIGIIGFIISGLMYILAAGDEKMIEKAKSGMKNSAIGVIVGIAGFVVIQAVDMILNGFSGI